MQPDNIDYTEQHANSNRKKKKIRIMTSPKRICQKESREDDTVKTMIRSDFTRRPQGIACDWMYGTASVLQKTKLNTLWSWEG